MSTAEKGTWWDRLCELVGLTWEIPDAPPLPVAALQSTSPASAAQNIYAQEGRLADLKLALLEATGVFVDHDKDLSLALDAGAAIIVEVAAKTEKVTVHSVPHEDMVTFTSLLEWAVFACSGREAGFDSTFFRMDVEPVQVARHQLEGGPIFIPHLSIRKSSSTSGDDGSDAESDGDGHKRGRKPGEAGEGGGPESAPVYVRPRPPRSR